MKRINCKCGASLTQLPVDCMQYVTASNWKQYVTASNWKQYVNWKLGESLRTRLVWSSKSLLADVAAVR